MFPKICIILPVICYKITFKGYNNYEKFRIIYIKKRFINDFLNITFITIITNLYKYLKSSRIT